MNILKKAFCRTYQFAFHLALPVLPYREPKILKNVEQIAEEVLKLDKKCVILITDEFLRTSGATQTLEKSLDDSRIKVIVYDKTRPNPTVENVDDVYKLYTQNNCECIIAFGGGSSMDCAKASGARIAHKGKSIDKLKGDLRVFKKLPPLFVVPTTAGTGSEVTVTAVITDDKKKHKYTMNSFPLIPHYAVLDPKVTFTLPKHLTATTGMDALTHAVEAYIGRSTSKETRLLSKQAVKLIFDNILVAYNDGYNQNARRNMLTAAYKAGIAFSKSYVGYIHAVAHSFGGQYNTPHGLANSVILPIFLREYGVAIHKKIYELAVYSGIAQKDDTYEVAFEKFVSKIEQYNEQMEIPKKLKGENKNDIPKMAEHADKEGNPLYPVPVLMDREKLTQMYYKVANWN